MTHNRCDFFLLGKLGVLGIWNLSPDKSICTRRRCFCWQTRTAIPSQTHVEHPRRLLLKQKESFCCTTSTDDVQIRWNFWPGPKDLAGSFAIQQTEKFTIFIYWPWMLLELVLEIFFFLFFLLSLVRCPTSYERAQNTRLHRQLTRAILHIASLAAHTTLNTYKPMEISIKRSPQH